MKSIGLSENLMAIGEKVIEFLDKRNLMVNTVGFNEAPYSKYLPSDISSFKTAELAYFSGLFLTAKIDEIEFALSLRRCIEPVFVVNYGTLQIFDKLHDIMSNNEIEVICPEEEQKIHAYSKIGQEVKTLEEFFDSYLAETENE